VRRFFVTADALAGEKSRLTGSLARRLSRVLRLRPGERIVLFSGDGVEHVILLERVAATQVAGRIVERRPGLPEPAVAVTLYQALLKGERFEWVLEKGTELGVVRFVPVTSGRAVVRRQGGGARAERWKRIVIEAAEQCGRAVVPQVEAPQSLDEALASASGLLLLPYERERALGLRSALHAAAELREVSVLVGPEGGFEADEVARAEADGAKIVSLGARILRSETAGIATVAALMYELGELGR